MTHSKANADLHWCHVTGHLTSLKGSVGVKQPIDWLGNEVWHKQMGLGQ